FFGVYTGHPEFGIDIRTLLGMTLAGLRADLDAFLEEMRRADPDLDVTAESIPDLAWFPPSSIDPQHPLVAAAQSSARDVLGRDFPLGTMPAFREAPHWHPPGSP